MNTEDFEKKLQGARMREVPETWREEILGGLLKKMEEEDARKRGSWRDLLWPSPLAWAALACIWCGIWISSMGAHSRQTQQAGTVSEETLMVQLAQARTLAENRGMPDL